MTGRFLPGPSRWPLVVIGAHGCFWLGVVQAKQGLVPSGLGAKSNAASVALR